MYIYRGESLMPARRAKSPNEAARIDQIQWFHRAGLSSALANGGNPYAIVELGLMDAVRRLLGDGGATPTSFLSFSLSKEQARYFATGIYPPDEEVELARGSEDSLWPWTRYAIFCFDIGERQAVSGAPGFYRLQYGGAHQALLIDSLEHLRSHAGSGDQWRIAADSAREDKEWLVLPLDPPADAVLHKGRELNVEHYVDIEYLETTGGRRR